MRGRGEIQCWSEVIKLINKTNKSMSSKSCKLDPVPTWLVKECLPELATVFTNIAYLSFASGIFPTELKNTRVTPILKDANLESDLFKNYRPVSNLPLFGKFLEKLVATRINSYFVEEGLNNKFQSAYMSHRSTESALLRVKNDLSMAVDRDGAAILVMLDL